MRDKNKYYINILEITHSEKADLKQPAPGEGFEISESEYFY